MKTFAFLWTRQSRWIHRMGWLVLTVALTTSSTVFGQNPPCVPPPAGMVAWWPLDEQAGATSVQDIAPAPSSVVSDTGSTLSGPVNSSGPMAVAGKVGAGALYFFGPYIDVPHSVDLAFSGSFSIDAWIRVVDCGHGGGGALATVVDKWDPATQTGVSFFVDQPTPATGWLKLQVNTMVFTATSPFPTAANPPANQGPWIHVAVTVDRTNQVGTFYINGAVAGTFTVPATGITNAVPLWIGLGRVSPSMCELAIDELELFDRALTAQEVLQLYAADTAGKCRPGPGPNAHICVEKFHDLNGNGFWDLNLNEPPLAGWQFVVTDLASNVVGVITSGLPGTPPGCLTLPPGTYVVTELLQPGWTNTTPVSQTVTVAPGQLHNMVFGNTTNQPGVAEICLIKFHDLDGDGTQDPGEPGLSGWPFVVNPPPVGLGTNVVTTGPGGTICVPVSAPGTYTITELPQAGWLSTCPAAQTVTVSPGQLVNLNFCNRRVCGDLNEVLNTGFNQSTSTVIPIGGLDDNWRVTVDPDPSTPEPRLANVVASTSWPAPLPNSRWTSFKPSAVPILPTPTVYHYEYCFCLAEGFSNAQLNVSIWADDIVDSVLLNGNAIGGGGGNFNGSPLSVATTNQALFRPGTNCVTIVVRDTHEGLTGINVIGSVTATNGMCCCVPPPPGLVAWWPLDDATNQTTVLDLAGGNHGTPKNSAGVTIPVGIPILRQLPHPGVLGGSLLPVVVDPSTSPPRGAFFFSDTYVEVPHHPSLNIGPNGLTITLWVWPTMGSGGPQPLVEKFDLASMNGYSLYLQPVGPNTFVLTMNLNGTVVTGPQITTSMTPSDWHFVVARVNAAGQVILGVCDMSNTCTNTVAVSVPNFLTTNTAPLWLSRSGAASATGVDVRAIRVGMDEVEIFGRALSLAELQVIYAAELAGMRKCPPLAEVCIFKFQDLNGDGVQDPGEPGLSGWQFVVNPAPLGSGTNVVTTGPGGSICFGVSAPGTYTITELPQAGWTNTTPISQTVTVAPGQWTHVLFGNKTIQPEPATLCIFKFHDLDGDGVQDPNEPLLPGWTVAVKYTNNVVALSLVTQTNPVCVLIAPGTFHISEVLPPPIGPWLPWSPTVPASGTYSNVTFLPGQTVTLAFGNRKNIKIVDAGMGGGPPSPLRLVIRMTAEPGEWYQLQYRESLDADSPWRDWGEPVQATEPEVTFEVPVEARQRQLYLRGIEKKDIWR